MAKHYGHNDGPARDTYVFHGYPRGFFRFSNKGIQTVRVESNTTVSHVPDYGDGDAISARQGFMSRYQSYLGARAFTAWQYLPPTHESSRGSITLPYLFES